MTFQDKLDILAAVDGEARVEIGVEILSRCDESLNLKKRIGDKVDQNLSRRQREYLLMQQLQAIRQELEELAAKDGAVVGGPKIGGAGRKGLSAGGGDEEEEDEVDDMAELEKAVKAKSWTEESRKVAMKELKRLKKSPPQGAEHGVIRESMLRVASLPFR